MAVAETEYRFGMTVLSAVFFPTILGQGAALEIEWIAKIPAELLVRHFVSLDLFHRGIISLVIWVI
jgi:hypothetical protein